MPLAITGGAGADSILGGSLGDVLSGDGGNDTIHGGGGNDLLAVSGGVDRLHGQAAAATAGSEANTLAIIVARLDTTKVTQVASGVRILNADDDTDLLIQNSGASAYNGSLAAYRITGTWRGEAVSTATAATTADGIQSFLVTDGHGKLAFQLAAPAAALVSDTAAEATIRRTTDGGVALGDGSLAASDLVGVTLFGSDGNDALTISGPRPVTALAGAGTDSVSMGWPGGLPVALAGRTLTLVQEAGTGAIRVSAVADDGTAQNLLTLSQTAAGENAYLASLTTASGAVVQHRLIGAELLRLDGIGARLDLSAGGVTGMTLTGGVDAVTLRTAAGVVLDTDAGMDTVTIDWATKLPALGDLTPGASRGSTVTASGYATGSAVTIATATRVGSIDLAASSFAMDGGYMALSTGKAILVDSSVAGQRTFWVAAYEDDNTKAVQIRLTDVADGISVRALQAKYVSGNVTDGSFDFNTGGNGQSVATSDNAAGYGVKGLTLASKAESFAFELLQDTGGWALQSTGSTLLSLSQIAAGQNAYSLVLRNKDGSTVTDQLSNAESLVLPQLHGIGLALGANGVASVTGSAGDDAIALSTLRTAEIDAGDGLDTLRLTWGSSSLPSLAAGGLSLTRDAGTTSWHLSAGSVKLLDVVQATAGANHYAITIWQSDGSSSTHSVRNAEFLRLSQLNGLKASLNGDAMLTSDGDLTLRLKNSVYQASIGNTIGTDSGTAATIQSGGVTRDQTLALNGQADAGSQVEILDGAKVIGTATLVGTNWTFTTPTLADGIHSLTARITDAGGNVATTAAVTATVRTSITQPAVALLTHDATAGGLGTSGAALTSNPSPLLLGKGQGTVVFAANDATKYGNAGTAFTDAATGTADLLVADTASGAVKLVTHGPSGTTASAGVAVTLNAITSDGRYVVFTNPNDASKFGNGGTSLIEPFPGSNVADILAYNVSTGALSLVSHGAAAGGATASATQSTYRDISGDGQYVIFSVGNVAGVGNGGTAFSGGGSGLIAYRLADGTQSLVTHAAGSLTTNSTGASYVAASGDGQYVLFRAPNATGYGNGGTAFTDTATATDDLFAYKLGDGTIKLLSHGGDSTQASAGVAVSYAGQNDDGTVVFFTTNDATKFGFTDGNTGKADLIAVSLADNAFRLISHTEASTTEAAGTSAGFLQTVGNQVYFWAEDATQLGAASDGNTAGRDLFRYDWQTGTTTLLSRASYAGTNALNGSLDLGGFVLSSDQRYVAYNVDTASGSYAGFSIGISGNVLYVADTVGGTVKLANHNTGSLTATGYQVWGGPSIKGFTPDAKTLVFDTGWLDWMGGGFQTSGTYDRGIFAYDLATGAQRLLTHTAGSATTLGTSATYATMTPDGKWVLFTANDATKFGNGGIAFTDATPATADLFAANVQTGEIRLLSGSAGVSAGSAATFVGVSEDGNNAFFTLGDVRGLSSAGLTLSDGNPSGVDILAMRLNLLDLATESDSTGGAAGTAFDNATASSTIRLTAALRPGQQAQLLDNGSPVGTGTADAAGAIEWTLSGVTAGTHRYSLLDAVELVPLSIDGSAATSYLDVILL